jgi:hypothetical protein
MRLLMAVLVCAFLLVGVGVAAEIDGKWVAERKIERDGQSFTIKQTFDLKSDGEKLSGKLSIAFGDQAMDAEIKDGKLSGNKFSFNATVSTPNGDFKSVYEGAVEGDTLKGTATRDGGQSRPFEATRSK